MVIEIGAPSPEALKLRQAWRYHRAAADCVSLAAEAEADIPRFAPSDPALDAFLRQRIPTSMLAAASDKRSASRSGRGEPSASSLPPVSSAPASPSAFAFGPEASSVLDLGQPALPPRIWRGVKRYRHGQDVDGPNTADLSCKKRRLRAELITSRLSQPFSQPATHILNREGMKSGDKRFLKIATTIDLSRRIAHLHATSFLRFSLMNSVRKRLGIVAARPAGSSSSGMEMASNSWQPPSLQAASGGKYLRPSTAPDGSTSRQPPPANGNKLVAPVARIPACRLSKPAALPRPSGEAVAANSRTSPRIHPVRSPELRPFTALEDVDEDSFAFLHSDDDGWCEAGDDPEHVYSDFGVIFGGASSSDAKSPEGHSYEEYLDELDGITWVAG